jgi:hypothetical protein
VLRPAIPDMLYASATDYHPEEVRELAREALRKERSTWVDTFALAWGFLDEDTQRELAATYPSYDPETWTPWALVFTAVFAGLSAPAALFYLLRGVGSVFEVALLAVAVRFLWETVVRVRGLREGWIPPSLVAPVVRPFARRLLAL